MNCQFKLSRERREGQNGAEFNTIEISLPLVVGDFLPTNLAYFFITKEFREKAAGYAFL